MLGYAADGGVAAYGQIGPDDSAELVVDPTSRRAGVGRDLAERLAGLGAERFWAHGDLPGARGLAAALGWAAVRDLHLMARPLAAADAEPVALPPGFLARGFRPGRDDEAWVATNAAAFAEHPEQGRLDLADLHERMALPWFDAAGLIVVEDSTRGPADPPMAAFHWTKVEDGVGEVYVLGVHPAYQGRGLATPLTRLGLAHLAARGIARVLLYVDGDNVRARRTYAGLGFVDESVDVMYAVPGAAAP